MFSSDLPQPSYDSVNLNNNQNNEAIPPLDGYNPNTDGTTLQPNSNEQMMEDRQQLKAQRKQKQQKYLEENYPVYLLIVPSILLGSLSLTAIVLQIVMIIKKSHYYKHGTGIWVGSYLLVYISLALLIS
jgi:hypothetical protein